MYTILYILLQDYTKKKEDKISTSKINDKTDTQLHKHRHF